MDNKLKELEKLITILKNEEGLTDYGVTLLEGWAVGMKWAVNKNCNLQSVSDTVCDNYDPEIGFPTGNGKCKNCGK